MNEISQHSSLIIIAIIGFGIFSAVMLLTAWFAVQNARKSHSMFAASYRRVWRNGATSALAWSVVSACAALTLGAELLKAQDLLQSNLLAGVAATSLLIAIVTLTMTLYYHRAARRDEEARRTPQ